MNSQLLSIKEEERTAYEMRNFSTRQFLYWIWAKLRYFYKFQPLFLIKWVCIFSSFVLIRLALKFHGLYTNNNTKHSGLANLEKIVGGMLGWINYYTLEI